VRFSVTRPEEVDQEVDLALDDRQLVVRPPVVAQLDQLQRRDDRRERVAQLVAEHREELVLDAVGLLGGDAGGALVLAALALGEVAGDLGEPDELAATVAHGGDHDVRPELAAVLADAPALVLEPAIAEGFLELVFALAGADVVLRIEHGEVTADDLVAGVALGALGAEVPGRHVSARVEQEDRVIADAGHEQAEQLVADHLAWHHKVVWRNESQIGYHAATACANRAGSQSRESRFVQTTATPQRALALVPSPARRKPGLARTRR
jgi:hypothetical protein